MKTITVIALLFLSGCAPVLASKHSSSPLATKAVRHVRIPAESTAKAGRDSALVIISTTIWGESANQDFNGKHAIASIIWNRSGGNPSKFKAVCLSPSQFSCWRNRVFTQPRPDLRKPLDRQAWRDCVALADSMLSGTFTPSVKVKHYAEKKIKNYWTEKMTLVAQIGDHNFYSK